MASLCVMVSGSGPLRPIWVQEFIIARPSSSLDDQEERERLPCAEVIVTLLLHSPAGKSAEGGQPPALRIAHFSRVQNVIDLSALFSEPENDWITAATNDLYQRRLRTTAGSPSVHFRMKLSEEVYGRLRAFSPEVAEAVTGGVEAEVLSWSPGRSNCHFTQLPAEDSDLRKTAPFIIFYLDALPQAEYSILRFSFLTDAGVDPNKSLRNIIYPAVGPLEMFNQWTTIAKELPDDIRHVYEARMQMLRQFEGDIQYEILLTGNPSYHYGIVEGEGHSYRPTVFHLKHSAAPDLGTVYAFFPSEKKFEIRMRAQYPGEVAPLLCEAVPDPSFEKFAEWLVGGRKDSHDT